MGRWAVAVVDTAGVVVTRGVAVYAGRLKPGGPRRVIVAIPVPPNAGTLAVGQAIVLRRSAQREVAGVVEAFGVNSAGAHTITIALDRR